MIIDFLDDEDVYGRIETNENIKDIEKLLNKYRESNEEEYNIDDFFIFLRENGIKFTEIQVEPDININF